MARKPSAVQSARKNQVVEISLDQDIAGQLGTAATRGFRRQANYLFDVRRSEAARAAARLAIEAANQAFGHGAQRARLSRGRQIHRREQVRDANPESFSLRPHEGAKAIFHQRVPENFFFARERGQSRQMIHGARRKIPFEQRHELRANPRALPVYVEIGRVFAPGLSQLPQIRSQFFAALAKKRSYNRTNRGINSRKARRPRPAKNVRENRLGLIVGRVRDHDACGATFRDQPLEKPIPEPSRGVLEIPFVRRRHSGNVFAPDDAFQPARAGKLLDKPSVRVRFRASKFVIEVNDE